MPAVQTAFIVLVLCEMIKASIFRSAVRSEKRYYRMIEKKTFVAGPSGPVPPHLATGPEGPATQAKALRTGLEIGCRLKVLQSTA